MCKKANKLKSDTKRVGILLTLLICLALTLCSCGKKNDTKKEEIKQDTKEDPNEDNTNPEVTNNSATHNDKRTAYQNQYSKGFSIEYLNNGIKKVIDGENRELILVPKSLGKIPDEYKNSNVITTPVENVVFLSTTQVGMLRAVNSDDVYDAVGGVSATEDWSHIEGIKSRLDSGKIKDIGDDTSNPDYEVIQELNPDIVFVYTGTNPHIDAISKLEELGINYAVDNEYMEDNYLARMEWMRFVLTFFNKDSDVDRIMKDAQATIDGVKDKINGLEKPNIAIFSIYDGTCYITLDNSWVGSMIADMGGKNVFSGIDSKTVTVEEAYVRARDADVIIYTPTSQYIPDIKAFEDVFPMIKDCKAYKDDKVYQYTIEFWRGIDQSQIMATDLATILYPDKLPSTKLTYFNKIAGVEKND